jgi:dTDP-glucose 4,6-dehydratase
MGRGEGQGATGRAILVTGGAGFIGSNFVRYFLGHHPADRVVNLDKLTYAGNLDSLAEIAGDERHEFVRGDIADRGLVRRLAARVDAIVNFAAESHVDRSIAGAEVFVRTNVLGTQVLLEAARAAGVPRFVQVSTDEVYGALGPQGAFTEESPLRPNSPYSASKAGADLLVRAYHHTFGLGAVVTRCSNNYGAYQHPEKLIPSFIIKALAGQPLPVYGDGLAVRDWLHVEDHCRALDLVLDAGRPGEVYNIGGSSERTNLEITTAILTHLGKPPSLIRFVPDRPGHDRRYAVDWGKINRELGWRPERSLEEGLAATVGWYLARRDWWEKLLTGG